MGLARQTPSRDAEAVNHSCVRVCADDAVGVKDVVVVEDGASKILKIHLN